MKMNGLEELILNAKNSITGRSVCDRIEKETKSYQIVSSYVAKVLKWIQSKKVPYYGTDVSLYEIMIEFCRADVLTELIRRVSKEYNRESTVKYSREKRSVGPLNYSKWLFGRAEEDTIIRANRCICTRKARIQQKGSTFEYVVSEAEKDFFRILYLMYNYEDLEKKERLHPASVVPLMAGNPWFVYGVERAWKLYELCEWTVEDKSDNVKEFAWKLEDDPLDEEEEMAILEALKGLSGRSLDKEATDLIDFLNGTSSMPDVYKKFLYENWPYPNYKRSDFVFLRMFWYRTHYEYWGQCYFLRGLKISGIDYAIGSTALVLVLNKVLKQLIVELSERIASKNRLYLTIESKIENTSDPIWLFMQRPMTWCYNQKLLAEMIQYFRDQATEFQEDKNEHKTIVDRVRKWNEKSENYQGEDTSREGFDLFESGFLENEYYNE